MLELVEAEASDEGAGAGPLHGYQHPRMRELSDVSVLLDSGPRAEAEEPVSSCVYSSEQIMQAVLRQSMNSAPVSHSQWGVVSSAEALLSQGASLPKKEKCNLIRSLLLTLDEDSSSELMESWASASPLAPLTNDLRNGPEKQTESKQSDTIANSPDWEIVMGEVWRAQGRVQAAELVPNPVLEERQRRRR